MLFHVNLVQCKTNMLEKRRIKRKHLIYYLRVFDINTDQVIGHLVDITTEGFMIMSEEPLKIDTIYQLRIDLPEEILGSRQITFEAKSIRCEKDVNPDFCNTGFLFENINPNYFLTISQLVDQFGFED